MTCADDPANPIIKDSASAIWLEIIKTINALEGFPRKAVAISGPAMFGVYDNKIRSLLAELPNADKCKLFALKTKGNIQKPEEDRYLPDDCK